MSAAPYALMWSGGKDGALCLRRARRAGLRVERLVNFHDAATGRVRFHGTRVEMIERQAAALGLELSAIATSWGEMEGRLLEELARLREEGFAGVVLGDIHLADVRAWYEERVLAAGLEHVEPIWGEAPSALLREYVDGGGKAVITCVDRTKLDDSWLGRRLDAAFLEEVAATGIDACGENGEYHSFAYGGLEFGSSEVGWRAGERREEPGFAQLDLLPA